MPIRNRDDAAEVEDRVERFFVAQADQRPDILRGLFGEVLDFQREVGQFGLDQARDRPGIELPAIAERIASLAGVQVLYVALPRSDTNTDTDRVRKSEVVAVAKRVRDNLGEDMLLLFSNGSANQLHWIHPQFGSVATPTLRRIVVERGIKQRTAVQQLSNIYWRHQDLGNILNALNEAFDVEPVTKQFFAKYKQLFEHAEQQITGFSDPEDRKQFVQTLFNRLMFVYFLSRKGWLKYDTKTDYLNELWKAYEAHAGHDNFYRDRLTFLFFEGLNNPDSRDVRGGVDFLIGEVPFLNGGLFEKSNLDNTVERERIPVPDDAIRPLMTNLFDQFNFTVMESTPFDIEVAVDPEMLGKVFEELVTGRHDSGAYYTPRPVVSFMCREALKGYLEGRLSGPLSDPLSPRERVRVRAQLHSDALARFVDHHDASDLSLSQAEQIRDALSEVTVVDPACGSGAYLVGMMQELVDLRVELYNQKLKQDPHSLYELKLHIIERNLHGVDLDPFAVNIAMLRLWLSLAIEYEGEKPEPLPNLDFKIVEGDSLLGPDLSETGQQGVLGYDGNAVNELRNLKSRYMTESEPNRKTQLREAITEAEATIREQLSHFAGADNALDWRIDFAEVIANGGFDIAVANPPYVAHDNISQAVKSNLKSNFDVWEPYADLYCYFIERTVTLLRPSGVSVLITSNSYFRAQYGRCTRAFLSASTSILGVISLDRTQIFENAIVDSAVVITQKGRRAPTKAWIATGPLATNDIDEFVATNAFVCEQSYFSERPWTLAAPNDLAILDKLRKQGPSLADLGTKIHLGVATGSNAAFLLDDGQRAQLLGQSRKNHEVIKPVLRGRDIDRYSYRTPSDYLLLTPNGTDVERDYPSVYRHFDSFGDGFKRRGAQGRHWTNLRPCSFLNDFKLPKIVWIELSDVGRFALCEEEMYVLNSAYFLLPPHQLDPRYLLGILNSLTVRYFLESTAGTSGMGTSRWINAYVREFPIPLVDETKQEAVATKVNEILNANPNADTTDLEREIDLLVYVLYDLTEEEISAIEARVGA